MSSRDQAKMRLDLGQRIRGFRSRRGQSQQEIARRAGITQASLSNYETGKREIPVGTLVRIAAALDISVGDLLEVPQLIVSRDSRLGSVMRMLMDSPDLIDSIARRREGALEAAS